MFILAAFKISSSETEPVESVEISSLNIQELYPLQFCTRHCMTVHAIFLFLQVARGGHRKGILATHTCCAGNTWYVDLAEEEMKKTLGKS